MSRRHNGTIKDILDNEVNIGDKVAFVPYSCDENQALWYGIVIRKANTCPGVYIKPLSAECDKEILRYNNQIIKYS